MIFDDFGKHEDIMVDDFCFFTRALREGLAKEEDEE